MKLTSDEAQLIIDALIKAADNHLTMIVKLPLQHPDRDTHTKAAHKYLQLKHKLLTYHTWTYYDHQ